MHRIIVGGAVLAAVIAVAGCTDSTAGTPTTTTSAAPAVTSPAVASSAAPVSDFSGEQLCGLLTADEAQRLGASGAGEPGINVSTGDPTCQWSDDTVIGLAFAARRTTDALKKGPGITITPGTFDGLAGVVSDNTTKPPLCQVVVNLTDHSSMAIAAGVHPSAESQYDRCTVAKQLADIVIPKIKG